MLRLRFSSAATAAASSSVKTTVPCFTLSATTTALLATPVRRYEYPGVGVSYRSPVHARGDKIPQTYENSQVVQRDADAYSLTGSSEAVAYDENTMYNPCAEVEKLSKKFAPFNGHIKIPLDPVPPKQCEIAIDLFEKMDKDAVWAAVLKDYPSLKTPLDEETRNKIMNLFEKGIKNVMDEKAVGEMCAPVVRELLETKFISQPYWWRFSEKINEQMAAAGKGVFHTRCATLVTERFTKTLYNTWDQIPWASDDYVSPLHADICGTRQCTEAGMW